MTILVTVNLNFSEARHPMSYSFFECFTNQLQNQTLKIASPKPSTSYIDFCMNKLELLAQCTPTKIFVLAHIVERPRQLEGSIDFVSRLLTTLTKHDNLNCMLIASPLKEKINEPKHLTERIVFEFWRFLCHEPLEVTLPKHLIDVT